MRACSLMCMLALVAACGKNRDGNDGRDTADGGTIGAANAELSSSGVVTCTDPTLRASSRFERRVSPSPLNSEIWVWAGGIVAADFDEDGHIDLVSPSESTARIYWGTAVGTFVEQDLPFDLSWGIGGTAVDHDGDGDLDLYVTRYEEPNVLLENQGGRQFADVTAAAGVACLVPDGEGGTKGGMSMSSSFADYDGDGDLDLFVGNYGWVDHSKDSASLFGPSEPSCLFTNDGDGTFTDVTDAQLPYSEFHPLHDGYIYVAGWHDLNDDGYPELYAVNDFGTAFPNVLLWNDAGTLRLDGHAHGLDLAMTGMGLGVNDLNGDGAPDMVVPIWNNIRLMMSYAVPGAEPIWTDIQGANGIVLSSARGQKVGWGAELQDMDNDADLDAVVAFGHVDDLDNPIWDNPFAQPDALFLQQPDGTFVDQGEMWGIADRGVSRGYAVADFNRDGWLDIAKRDLDGPNVFYVSRCGSEAWLTVNLRAPGPNTRGIGAKITATVGDTTQIRWIRAGGTNHATGLPPEVHFGFGEVDTIDRLEIRWPDGEVSTFENVTPRQHVTISRHGA